jgi:hypothetical protein
MDDEEDQEERADLIARMFALLTAKLEDAAGIAADCQARRPAEELCEGADKLVTLSEEATVLALAARALLAEKGPSCRHVDQ